MQPEKHLVWEDDGHIVVSEELLEHFPEEFRQQMEVIREQAGSALQIVDEDIQNLETLIKAILVPSSLKYIYRRLRNVPFEPTTEWWMEQELLTTAFIITYGRLFVSSRNCTKLNDKDVPSRLKSAHKEIIDLRGSVAQIPCGIHLMNPAW